MTKPPQIFRVSAEILKYLREGGDLYVSGQLKVVVEVQNHGANTRVGIRYTLNEWNSWKEIDGVWSSHCETTKTDQFLIFSDSTIPPGTLLKYALFCNVNNQTYWDNNHCQNYTAQF